MTGGGWRDMSTAPRDGTAVEVMWLERESWDIAAVEEQTLFVRWDGTGWWTGGNREHFDGYVGEPEGWRPLGGTP